MPLKSRAAGVQAPAEKPAEKPVTNRARQATSLEEAAQTDPPGQETAGAPDNNDGAANAPAPRRGRAAAPVEVGATKPERRPRATKVAADGGETVENPKARLKEIEAQAKQLFKDEATAIAEVTAEYRDKRRALQQEHARIQQLASKSIFG